MSTTVSLNDVRAPTNFSLDYHNEKAPQFLFNCLENHITGRKRYLSFFLSETPNHHKFFIILLMDIRYYYCHHLDDAY